MLDLFAAALFASTVNLDAGTVLCRTEATANEYLKAQAVDDQQRLAWLSGSCYALARDFQGQRVLGQGDGILIIEWTNGRFKKVRYALEKA